MIGPPGLGVKYDERWSLIGWRATLDHLVRNGCFVVEKSHIEWSVGKGPRLLAVDEEAGA